MLIHLYEILSNCDAQPKTYNPIRLAERRMLRNEIMKRIHAELDYRISLIEN